MHYFILIGKPLEIVECLE